MPLPSRACAPFAALALLTTLAAACRAPSTVARIGARVAAADSAARAAVAREREIDAAAIPAGTVAVVPLSAPPGDTLFADLAYGIADLLIADLAQSRRLRVVDRIRLDAILRELELGRSGLVDSASGVRVGRLLGARSLVAGALAPTGDRAIRLDVRVANVPTGAIQSGLAASAPIDRILDAQKALAFRVFDLLGVALTPAERAAIAQFPTRDLAALLAFSRGVRAEAARDFDRAAAEYERAVRSDPSFTAARVNLGALRGQPVTASTPLMRAATLAVNGVNASEFGVLRTAADAAVIAAPLTVPLSITVNIP